MSSTQIIFYDEMPDFTVSVLVKGSDDWDLFKSSYLLHSWCLSEFQDFELVDITNTTYSERVALGVFDNE